MKKKQPKSNAKKKQPKTLGTFKILKETPIEYVKMDVEMSDDLFAFFVKIGKRVAKSDPSIYMNIGLHDIVMKNIKDEPAK